MFHHNHVIQEYIDGCYIRTFVILIVDISIYDSDYFTYWMENLWMKLIYLFTESVTLEAFYATSNSYITSTAILSAEL